MEELALKESGSLFGNGTELSHLQDIANSHGFVTTESKEAIKIYARSIIYNQNGIVLSTLKVKRLVIEQINNNNPVILWIHSDANCNH